MGRKSRSKAERAAGPAVATAAPRPAEPSPDTRIISGMAVGIVILVAVVFAQLRDHQFVDYDDPIYITNNAQVQRGLTAESVSWAFRSFDFNWHPVTWLTHLVDVQLFGLNAGAHLLVNAAIHAINAVLLLFILTRATGAPWRSGIVAALFAVHPLHVESVAWISERKDVLSTLFFLLTIWFYLRFVERRSGAAYVAMLATFILGLMSKGMLVTLPLVLLLLDYWPLRRFNLREKVPLFALMIPSVFVTYYAQHKAAALADVTAVPLSIRLANATISYALYIRKMFWPDDLAVGYPYPSTISPSTTFACLILLAAVTALVIWLRERRYLFTGWFWFAGTLVPVIGIVQIGSQSMADRYTYIPIIGLFMALVWLCADFVAARPKLRVPATAMAAIIIIALTLAARAQASYWRDSETLFRHAVQATAGNWVAHESLGFALYRKGDFPGAIEQFQALTALRPRYARGFEGLGASLLGLGRTAEATEAYRTAVRLNPASGEAQRHLGNLAMSAGNAGEAKASLEKAASLGDPDALGALAAARGDLDGAVAEYTKSVKQNPKSPVAHNNLASALARKGKDAEALEHYRAALALEPNQYDANMNVGALLSRLGRNDEAASHFLAAGRARPQSTEPHIYAALLKASSGKFDEALAEAEQAMKINAETANTELTNALRIPKKETNLQEYVAMLRARAGRS